LKGTVAALDPDWWKPMTDDWWKPMTDEEVEALLDGLKVCVGVGGWECLGDWPLEVGR
jgi:hypothetical protein